MNSNNNSNTDMVQKKPLKFRVPDQLTTCAPEDSAINCIDYTQGFLNSQVGRAVKVEFLIGTGLYLDKEGTLVKVGADYIIIQETGTDDYTLCDLYSIKFVTFYY